jgi:hypothetical protein
MFDTVQCDCLWPDLLECSLGQVNSRIGKSQSSYGPYLIVEIYIGLGEKQQALDWLEKAYEERERLGRVVEVRPHPLQGADADAARVRALATYNEFLTLWKDADPDIPILNGSESRVREAAVIKPCPRASPAPPLLGGSRWIRTIRATAL